MKANMNGTQRAIRAVIGLILLGVACYYKNWLVGVIGIIPLISAATGYCPLYCKGGTCAPKEEKPTDHEHKHGDGCCH